ncbi:hypothetical protein FA047_01180 [Pedobacter frigoris]|uniref:Outer membrane protein beta-barrel domain-containing protein n=2 Tax=Pedobacter frigoris TaxID=2571272 RepID=A0A4U1CQ76_9SPHI|nr:hypothetical protein FA047_01180 [Pedobacter frigoris]
MIPNSIAQSRGKITGQPRLGLGLDFAFPTGDFGDRANYGFGGSVNYLHPVGKFLNIIGNVGYLRLEGDDVGPFKYTEGYVPIKAGARYYITQNIYGEGQAGIAIPTANGSGSGTAFAYMPGLGVDFPVSEDLNIELTLRYENWARSNGTRSFVGLRAGISF